MFPSKPETFLCILSGLSKDKKEDFCHLVYWIFHYSLHQSGDNKQFCNTLLPVLMGVPLFHVGLKPLSSFKGNQKWYCHS